MGLHTAVTFSVTSEPALTVSEAQFVPLLVKLKAKLNEILSPLPLLRSLSLDEQTGTESPPSPSLAGELMTLHVAGSCGEAHCSEMHKASGWRGKLEEGVYGGGGS